jgi:hypothetical protein
MADYSADDLFSDLQEFKRKYIKEDMQGKENDTDILRATCKMLGVDLRFTFNPVREAHLPIGFGVPTK